MHDIKKTNKTNNFTNSQKGAIVLVETKKVEKTTRYETLRLNLLKVSKWLNDPLNIYFMKAIALTIAMAVVILLMIFWH